MRARTLRATALVVTALAVLAAAAHVASGALAARAGEAVRPSLRVPADPLFSLRGLQPGDRTSRCVSVDARDTAGLSFFGGGENGPLAPHLHVRLLRGCNGDEVLFEGRLSELPLERDAIPTRTTDVRIDVTVLATAPQSARATTALGFGADAAAAPRAAATRSCRSVTSRGVRLGRVFATITARADGPRVRLKTALRIRGKTLRQRWATVAYRLEGRGWQTTRRPFRLTTQRTSAATSVLVRIRPTRRRSATLRLPLCEVPR